MAKKRGAKPDFVIHPETGYEIEGLYFNKDKKGRIRFYYYIDENGKQITCTSDIRKAIKRFNAYKEENKYPDLIEIPDEAKSVPISRYGAYIDDDYVNKDWIIEQFQEILNSDRKRVVDVSGNSNYWDFENTPSRPQSLTCTEVLDEYLNLPRKKPLNTDYRYKIIRHWNTFKTVTGKLYIRDITFKDVQKYRLEILKEAEQKNATGKITRPDLYVNERFSAIHDIISKIRDVQEYKRDIDTLLDHIGQLIRMSKKTVRVKVVDKEQWSILYKHSENDLFIRCGLLLGLNCAMTWGDIIKLTMDNFDFRKQTYIGTRSKNDIQNCAMLFPETVDCLQQYIKHHPSTNENIFYFKNAMPKTLVNGAIESFDKWKGALPKRKFKQVEHITQKLMRKSAKTAATKARCQTEYIKLVMGRRLEGAEEHYTDKDAVMTKDVINAVYKNYFGKSIT
jgi:integrase